VRGVLYGTTEYGGPARAGTIYRLTTDGNEEILYRFRGRPDGATPNGDLIKLADGFYGTTVAGGANGKGTAYRVSNSGQETVLFNFATHDGSEPNNLIELNGSLYGTTTGPNVDLQSAGTVFALATSGKEQVLHRFGSGMDGKVPTGLIAVGSTLYGTTTFGGAQYCGTIFTLEP
jgi:uncharacterized repeat protein (TIGR03803 family)